MIIYHPTKTTRWSSAPKLTTPLLAVAINHGYQIGDPKSRIAREDIMTLLIKRGSDPLMELHEGKTTVLHEICYHYGLIRPILKAEVDLEVKYSQGRTPLLAACSSSYRVMEDESTTCELILAGADIHATDNTNSSPLHLATKSGLIKTVLLLLEKGAQVSASDNAGHSPFFYALTTLSEWTLQVRLKMTKALLSAGADPLTKGPNGESALHLLDPSLIQLSPIDGEEAKYRDYDRISGTRKHSLGDFTDLYQQFVDRGCQRNGCDNLGNTPLFPYVVEIKTRHECININPPAEEDMQKMFDEHDVFAVNYDGDTLLHAVAGRNEEDGTELDGVWLFKELMSRSLDPRKENKTGISALDVAATCGKEDILQLFTREE